MNNAVTRKLIFSSLLPQGPQQGMWVREVLFDAGTCVAAQFSHSCSRMREVTNLRDKQHHSMPVWMLPLTLGPLDTSTI